MQQPDMKEKAQALPQFKCSVHANVGPMVVVFTVKAPNGELLRQGPYCLDCLRQLAIAQDLKVCEPC